MRKRVRLVSFASFLTLFAMLLAACGGTTTTTGSGTPAPTAAKAALTVGIVTDVGGLNDGGFNQFSHAGYEKARAQYGFPDLVIQSQVISDAEYTKNITQEAQQADMVSA
jgi:basic membrane protein A